MRDPSLSLHLCQQQQQQQQQFIQFANNLGLCYLQY